MAVFGQASTCDESDIASSDDCYMQHENPLRSTLLYAVKDDQASQYQIVDA